MSAVSFTEIFTDPKINVEFKGTPHSEAHLSCTARLQPEHGAGLEQQAWLVTGGRHSFAVWQPDRAGEWKPALSAANWDSMNQMLQRKSSSPSCNTWPWCPGGGRASSRQEENTQDRCGEIERGSEKTLEISTTGVWGTFKKICNMRPASSATCWGWAHGWHRIKSQSFSSGSTFRSRSLQWFCPYMERLALGRQKKGHIWRVWKA